MGNITFNSAVELIQNGSLNVTHQYIFMAIGSNQVYSANQHDVTKYVNRTIFTLLSKNADAKIFVLPVLPRPVDDKHVKSHIIEFNRILSSAVKKLALESVNVKFLAVQNCFTADGRADNRLYSQTWYLLTNRDVVSFVIWCFSTLVL